MPAKDKRQFHALLDKDTSMVDLETKRADIPDFICQSIKSKSFDCINNLFIGDDGFPMLLQLPASLAQIAKESEVNLPGVEAATSMANNFNLQNIPKSNVG